jgi:hypothetical protein
VKVIACFFVFAAIAVACSIAVAAPGADSQPGYRLVTDSQPCETPPDNCLTDNSCCESSCVGDLCECGNRPLLDAQVSWLYMWRTKPDNTDILLDANRGPLLGGRDFDLGPKSGIDATLIYRRPCGGAIDVRYLWIDAYTANASAPVSGAFFVNTTPSTSGQAATATTGDFRYMSKFQSVEANVHKEFSRFDWLFGLRYADFRESLDGTFLVGSQPETMTWGRERNDLYGFQTGVDAVLWEPCYGLRIGVIGKAGIYYNDIHTDFDYTYRPNLTLAPDNSITSSDSTSKAAFLGEIGLNATYQINSHLAVRAGYQMMWLSGVATAVDQVPATSNFNSFASRPNGTANRVIDSHANGDSSVFYHGVNAGLEYTW